VPVLETASFIVLYTTDKKRFVVVGVPSATNVKKRK
jgi:hypothetical protein